MKLTLDYPPIWLIAFMAVAWGISLVSAPWGDAVLWPGRALIVLGLIIMVLAAIEFRRARTTIVPHEEPSALVETGPYRFSRNPIYAADLVILAGWCLTCGAPLALLLLFPFAWVLERRFIRPEEARLAQHLGRQYLAYRARVRRWI